MWSIPFEIIKELLAAWQGGQRKVKAAIVASIVLTGSGLLIFLVSDNLLFDYFARVGRVLGALAGGSGVITAILIVSLQKSKEAVKQEQKLEAVERRVQQNPKETQATWDLARI